MGFRYQAPDDAGLRYRYAVYRKFVWWTVLAAGHVLLILAVLAFFTIGPGA